MPTHARTAALAAALSVALGCSGGDDPADDPAPAPKVFFTEPASPLHVRGGAIALRVFVDGVPARVDLYKDGAPLVNLGASGHYEYVWSADGAAERVHRFTARAEIDGKREESPPLDVVVDRTPPSLTASQPAAGATRVGPGTPIVLTFDEPLAATSVGAPATVRVAGVLREGALATGPDPRTLEVRVDGAAGARGEGPVEIQLGPGVRDLAGNELAVTSLGFSLLTWERLGGGPLDVWSGGGPVALLGAGPIVALSSGTFWSPSGSTWTPAFPYEVAPDWSLGAAAQGGDGVLAVWSRADGGVVVRRFADAAVLPLEPIPLVNPGASPGAPTILRASPPVVAWSEWTVVDGTGQMRGPYVRALDEGGWQPREPAGSEGAYTWLAASGPEPVAAWYALAGAGAARLGGTGWSAIAAPPTNLAAMALGPDGAPVAVTWDLELLVLGASGWRSLGRAAEGALTLAQPSLAAGPGGAVLVGWVSWEPDAPGRVNAVLHREGDGFRTVASDLQTDGASPYWLAVAFDAAGAPLLAWAEDAGVHVRRLAP